MHTSEAPHGSAFACRHCQSYTPEGRRGGHCQLLNVTVQGCWRSCSVGTLSFTPTLAPAVEHRPQPVRWVEEVQPCLVETTASELVNSMAFASSVAMHEAIPMGITRFHEAVADPSAA